MSRNTLKTLSIATLGLLGACGTKPVEPESRLARVSAQDFAVALEHEAWFARARVTLPSGQVVTSDENDVIYVPAGTVGVVEVTAAKRTCEAGPFPRLQVAIARQEVSFEPEMDVEIRAKLSRKFVNQRVISVGAPAVNGYKLPLQGLLCDALPDGGAQADLPVRDEGGLLIEGLLVAPTANPTPNPTATPGPTATPTPVPTTDGDDEIVVVVPVRPGPEATPTPVLKPLPPAPVFSIESRLLDAPIYYVADEHARVAFSGSWTYQANTVDLFRLEIAGQPVEGCSVATGNIVRNDYRTQVFSGELDWECSVVLPATAIEALPGDRNETLHLPVAIVASNADGAVIATHEALIPVRKDLLPTPDLVFTASAAATPTEGYFPADEWGAVPVPVSVFAQWQYFPTKIRGVRITTPGHSTDLLVRTLNYNGENYGFRAALYADTITASSHVFVPKSVVDALSGRAGDNLALPLVATVFDFAGNVIDVRNFSVPVRKEADPVTTLGFTPVELRHPTGSVFQAAAQAVDTTDPSVVVVQVPLELTTFNSMLKRRFVDASLKVVSSDPEARARVSNYVIQASGVTQTTINASEWSRLVDVDLNRGVTMHCVYDSTNVRSRYVSDLRIRREGSLVGASLDQSWRFETPWQDGTACPL